MPGKVSNFLWRVCKGCLPTVHALVMKHVDVNASCPWCHSGLESDVHVLFECDFAKTVWQFTGLQHLFQILPNDTSFEVLIRMFYVCAREQCVLIGMMCWSIWNQRNKWVWERANGSAFGVKAAAMNLLCDWREAQAEGMKSKSQMSTCARRWSKPPGGWVKINIDAAVFQNGGIGVGCVIRDSHGQFVSARCSRVEGNWQPKEAEALSLNEALSWAKSLSLNYCIFETDSKVLAVACNEKRGEAYFDTIVLDCIQEMKHFDQVLVEFVYRSANDVAHLLAKAAHSMSGLGEWHVTPPDFINHVLDCDII